MVVKSREEQDCMATQKGARRMKDHLSCKSGFTTMVIFKALWLLFLHSCGSARLVQALRKAGSSTSARNLQGFTYVSDPVLADYFGGEPGFYHSVASGDPLVDAVIIWTRYTPASIDEEILMEFRMAPTNSDVDFDDLLDPQVNPDLRRGTVLVTSETDFVAKIDVTGLPSNTKFVYSFNTDTEASDVGMTRTAPAPEDGVDELRYAVFSCSNFRTGFFHAYDIASTIEDLDLWIHTGDWIYVSLVLEPKEGKCLLDQ